MASLPNIKTIHSVDSTIEWINQAQKDNNVKEKVTFHYVDINADPHNWGQPKDESKIQAWPNYSSALQNLSYYPDMVFIDGRFRVACALKSIENIRDDSYLIIHDYVNRPQYHIIEKYFQRKDEADTLCILKKKKNIDMDEVSWYLTKFTRRGWDKSGYEYDPHS